MAIEKLTALEVEKAAPRFRDNGNPVEYQLSDSGGLALVVKPNGGKSWVFRYQGKKMGLGGYPNVSLSEDTRAVLVKNLCEEISGRMDGVPVFAAVHMPDAGEKNWHVHVSYPTRIIESDGTKDGFKLGRKIAFEQQGAWREQHGLEKTNREEFMSLRGALAGHCADALQHDGVSRPIVERWRNGHLRLNKGPKNQIVAAKQRGDDEFVKDNRHREVQIHEGPGFIRDGGETPAQEHNANLEPLASEILVENIMRSVIIQAETEGIRDWEGLRKLAADRGLTIHFNRTRLKGGYGQVSGLRYEIGGIKMPGKNAGGLSLGGLRNELKAKGLSFADTSPTYAAPPPLGEGWQAARADALHSAFGIPHPAPAPQAPKAQANKPRPRRASGSSSKGHSADAIGLDKLMADLVALPDEPVPAPAPIIELSDASKNIMISLVTGGKKETLGLMRKRVNQLQAVVDEGMAREPNKTKGHFGRKNHAYEKWRLQTNESIEQLSKQARALEQWLEGNIYTDRELLLELNRHYTMQQKRRLDAALDSYKKAASRAAVPGFGPTAKKRMAELRAQHPHIEAFAQDQARLEASRRGRGQGHQGQRYKQKG